MEEGLKSRIILILGIIAAIFFISTISSCMDARRIRAAKNKEMFTRIDLEEKAEKFNSERSALDEKIKKLERSLEEVRLELNKTKESFLQQQVSTKSLTEELEKLTKLKEALEENLKEALVGKPPKKVK
jgi:septal ring factor EnvC (AmiA/AmiB activator)